MSNLEKENREHSFFSLTPESILDAVEATGFRCTGRCLALNSMENRVYEVEIEPEEGEVEDDLPQRKRFVIAKFYRPGRWSREQLQAEHLFLADLRENDIPGVCPLPLGGEGLQTIGVTPAGIYFAIFPKVGGRQPDELNPEQSAIVGRLLARLHAVGASRKDSARMHITPETFGLDNLRALREQKLLPPHIEPAYAAAVESIVELTSPWFADAPKQRIHGDCHFGNLLYGEHGFFWVDFDDMLIGPPVQDLWLLLPGRDEYALRQFQLLLRAYQEWADFDLRTLRLIEPLRALRMIHFNTWLAKRWHDPAFPRAFPHFAAPDFWDRATHDLRDMLASIEEENRNGRPFWQPA